MVENELTREAPGGVVDHGFREDRRHEVAADGHGPGEHRRGRVDSEVVRRSDQRFDSQSFQLFPCFWQSKYAP